MFGSEGGPLDVCWGQEVERKHTITSVVVSTN